MVRESKETEGVIKDIMTSWVASQVRSRVSVGMYSQVWWNSLIPEHALRRQIIQAAAQDVTYYPHGKVGQG